MDFLNANSHRSDLNYVRTFMNMPFLEREKEQELAYAWKEDRDEKARHELICSYMRLVISTAIRYRHYGLPLSDLIQEGNMGLMHAAERFEPVREVRFSTYAKWWIRASIQEFILRNWSIVRAGTTSAHKALFFNLNRLRAQLSQTTADPMNHDERCEIADLLQVSIQDVEIMGNRLSGHDLSLSNPISEFGDDDWQAQISDTRPTPEEASMEEDDTQSRRSWITGAMQCLDDRETYIISKRRLIDPPKTLESIGKKLSITKERARQIEAKALRKMKYYLLESIHDVKYIIKR
ncbi:MAG: RNA polymerase factor sigma-32 [Alphaproteobacteria bacterium]|nr:RNA polymerase factor sigma-32 [Alphaproteobacteria bacterium]